jgi:hypothetical protein
MSPAPSHDDLTQGSTGAPGLPSAVREFLATHVQSLEALEVLLVLQRESERWWSAESLAAELGVPRSAAAARLEEVASRNLLDVRISDGIFYRYGPASPSIDSAVRATVETYSRKPLAVTRALYSPPMDDIRSFADAFRIRKREGSDRG